jgi:phosphoribosylanthranilate isomerase
MSGILIKICGMKDPDNIAAVVKLKPHYLGFILYERSPRYIDPETAGNLVKSIPRSIKKTAVLVNEPIENAIAIAGRGVFDLIQLHGNETSEYCKKLSGHIRIIKAFSVSDTLPENLEEYEQACSLFLFDTAGEKAGGTGKKFNHSLLKNYSLNTGFILSGGIGPADSEYIKSINHEKMVGVDLNSRFETEPGIKDMNLLKQFIGKIRDNDKND